MNTRIEEMMGEVTRQSIVNVLGGENGDMRLSVPRTWATFKKQQDMSQFNLDISDLLERVATPQVIYAVIHYDSSFSEHQNVYVINAYENIGK